MYDALRDIATGDEYAKDRTGFDYATGMVFIGLKMLSRDFDSRAGTKRFQKE